MENGETAMMDVKMAGIVVAMIMSAAVSASGLTSGPTFVFLKSETSSFWHTATNSTLTLPIVYPKCATRATRTVSGVAFATRTYADIVGKTFNLELPVPDSPQAEKGWKPLLHFDGTKTAGVSVRRGADCTEVYIALPGAITAQFCRNLAREAGFEPLVESDELSGCGSGIFYMVAQTSGAKRFRLPKGLKPGEVLAGPAFKPAGDGLYSADMKIGDIFVLSCVRVAGR